MLKKIISLFLIFAFILLSGLLLGCQSTNNTHADSAASNTSSDPSGHATVGPYEYDPPIADIWVIIDSTDCP